MLKTAIVLISHQTPKEVASMCAEWQRLNPEALVHVAYGGSEEVFAELTWPGRVDIGTAVADMGRSSFTLEQGLFQNGQCVATAQTTIVQMNESTRRSHPLSAATVQRLSSLKLSAPDAMST